MNGKKKKSIVEIRAERLRAELKKYALLNELGGAPEEPLVTDAEPDSPSGDLLAELVASSGRLFLSLPDENRSAFVLEWFDTLSSMENGDSSERPFLPGGVNIELAILDRLDNRPDEAEHLLAGTGLVSGYFDGRSGGSKGRVVWSGYVPALARHAAETGNVRVFAMMSRILDPGFFPLDVSSGLAESNALLNEHAARAAAESLPLSVGGGWLADRGHFDLAAEFETVHMSVNRIVSGLPDAEWIRKNARTLTERKLRLMGEGFARAVENSFGGDANEEPSVLAVGAGRLASAFAAVLSERPDMSDAFSGFSNTCAYALSSRRGATDVAEALRTSAVEAYFASRRFFTEFGGAPEAAENICVEAVSGVVKDFIVPFAGENALSIARAEYAAGILGFEIPVKAGDLPYLSSSPFIFDVGARLANNAFSRIAAKLSNRFFGGLNTNERNRAGTGLDRDPLRFVAKLLSEGNADPDVVGILSNSRGAAGALSGIAAFAPDVLRRLRRETRENVCGTGLSSDDLERMFHEKLGITPEWDSDAARAVLFDMFLTELASAHPGARGRIFESAYSSRPDIFSEGFLNSTHPGFGAPVLFVFAACMTACGLGDASRSLVKRLLWKKSSLPVEERAPLLVLGAGYGFDTTRFIPDGCGRIRLGDGVAGSFGTLWPVLASGAGNVGEAWKKFEAAVGEEPGFRPSLGDALLLFSRPVARKSFFVRDDLTREGVRSLALNEVRLPGGVGFVSGEALVAVFGKDVCEHAFRPGSRVFSEEEKKSIVLKNLAGEGGDPGSDGKVSFFHKYPSAVLLEFGFCPDDPAYWCAPDTSNSRHPLNALVDAHFSGKDVSKTVDRLFSYFEKDYEYWRRLFSNGTGYSDSGRGRTAFGKMSGRAESPFEGFALLSTPPCKDEKEREERMGTLLSTIPAASASNVLIRPDDSPESAAAFLFGVSTIEARTQRPFVRKGNMFPDADPMFRRFRVVGRNSLVRAALAESTLSSLAGETGFGVSEDGCKRFAASLLKFVFSTSDGARFAEELPLMVAEGNSGARMLASVCDELFDFESPEFGYDSSRVDFFLTVLDKHIESEEETKNGIRNTLLLFEKGSGRFAAFMDRLGAAIAAVDSEEEYNEVVL